MKQLVIAGMHRSGTSLLANAAERAGINMGDQILASGKGNLPGHFEDVEFVHFHEHLLESRGWSALFPPDQALVASPAERRTARSLVEARAAKPLWGFKDPRAALVLDLWDDLLDDPFFLLVYRHPIEVVLSLLRRGIDLDVQADPGSALRAWTLHNRLLLEFRRAHPERCLLWSVHGATRSLTAAFRMLEQRIQRQLAVEDVRETFEGKYLQAGLAAVDIRWEALLPEVFTLYQELETAADLPAAGDHLLRAETPDRDLREVAEHLLATVLGGPPGVARASAADRVAYSDLRQLNFRHEQRTEALTATVQSLESTARSLETGIQEREARLRSLEDTVQSLEAMVQSLEARGQSLAAEVQRLETAIQHRESKLGEVASKLAHTEAELSAARDAGVSREQNLVAVSRRLAESERFGEVLLAERRALEEEQRKLGRTRGWRLLQAYWSLTRRWKGP